MKTSSQPSRFIVWARLPGASLEVQVVDAPDGLTRSEAKAVIRTAEKNSGYEGANFRLEPYESPMGFQS